MNLEIEKERMIEKAREVLEKSYERQRQGMAGVIREAVNTGYRIGAEEYSWRPDEETVKRWKAEAQALLDENLKLTEENEKLRATVAENEKLKEDNAHMAEALGLKDKAVLISPWITIYELMKKISEHEKTIAEQKARIEELNKYVGKRGEEIISERQKCESLEKTVKAQWNELDEYKKDEKWYKDCIAGRGEQIDQLMEKCNELAKVNAEQKEEIASKDRLINELKERVWQLADEKEALEATFAELNKTFKTVKEDWDALKEENKVEKNTRMINERILYDTKEERDVLRARCEELANKVHVRDEHIEGLNEKNRELKKQIGEQDEQIECAKIENVALGKKVAELTLMKANPEYGYTAGAHDAWEVAKKVALMKYEGGLDVDLLDQEFRCSLSNILKKPFKEVQAGIQRIEERIGKKEKAPDPDNGAGEWATEENTRVGDEIEKDGKRLVVLEMPRENYNWFGVLKENGHAYYSTTGMADCKKTGRHFDIDKILEKMRNPDRE